MRSVRAPLLEHCLYDSWACTCVLLSQSVPKQVSASAGCYAVRFCRGAQADTMDAVLRRQQRVLCRSHVLALLALGEDLRVSPGEQQFGLERGCRRIAIVESAIFSLIQSRVRLRWDDLRLLKSPACAARPLAAMSCSAVRGCCWQYRLL